MWEVSVLCQKMQKKKEEREREEAEREGHAKEAAAKRAEIKTVSLLLSKAPPYRDPYMRMRFLVFIQNHTFSCFFRPAGSRLGKPYR